MKIDAATVLSIIEFGIAQEPKVADSLKTLFGKGDPTPEDWDAERTRVSALTYENLVPDSQLPPTPPAAA
jgi:hypothetical protein